MRIVIGVLLILLAVGWADFWCAAAGTTTETGTPNAATFAAIAVAALGLIPLAGGLLLVTRAAQRFRRYFLK